MPSKGPSVCQRPPGNAWSSPRKHCWAPRALYQGRLSNSRVTVSRGPWVCGPHHRTRMRLLQRFLALWKRRVAKLSGRKRTRLNLFTSTTRVSGSSPARAHLKRPICNCWRTALAHFGDLSTTLEWPAVLSKPSEFCRADHALVPELTSGEVHLLL